MDPRIDLPLFSRRPRRFARPGVRGGPPARTRLRLALRRALLHLALRRVLPGFPSRAPARVGANRFRPALEGWFLGWNRRGGSRAAWEPRLRDAEHLACDRVECLPIGQAVGPAVDPPRDFLERVGG